MVNVFIDIESSGEVVSDAYKFTAPFDNDDFKAVAFEVPSSYIKVGSEDFGISANVDEDAGEGATAEGGDSDAKRVIDVVHTFALEQSPILGDKATFKGFIAGYMKNVLLPKVPESDVAAFKANATKLIQKMLVEFGNAEIYVPETAAEMEDPTLAIPIYAYWKDGEDAPRFIFFKHALKEVKY